ncbi:LAMI_0G07536g1_1 [Lachancea mirantina]|uniref:LAMI_0G07536g1_1 n=1 Tax=Lachancea mirantina TaxID=1230905 RepID=A0A1G4K9J8_9SACH|nr:LAMI_0G07536g1_1 [Lachancea mirantina]
METREILKSLEVPSKVQIPDEDSLKEAIWKTVDYVFRNGREFEQKLSLTQFPFIGEESEFRPYYEHLLGYMFGNSSDVNTTGRDADSEVSEPPAQLAIDEDNNRDCVREAPETPVPFVFSAHKAELAAFDLEILKTTALFCAINAKNNYLSLITERYKDDETFGFLKGNHVLNETFMGLIIQYQKVLEGDFKHLTDLDRNFQKTVLTRSFQRARYEEYAQEQQIELKKASDRLKIKFSACNWENFTLVGKVVFDESSPAASEPLDFKKISQLSLIQSPTDVFSSAQLLFESESLEIETPSKPQSKKKNKIKIKAAGETRLKGTRRSLEPEGTATNLIECPITGKMVLENDFDRHLQILLSDPNYVAEREAYKAKTGISNLTTQNVHENIKKLSMDPQQKQLSKRQKTNYH